MLLNRIWLRNLVKNRKYHSTKKSKIRRTNDRKNSMLKPIGSDCGNESNPDIITKRRKTMENTEIHNTNVDRISELPEPVIHHIFAFMKCTKDVARTTVLSKKWKNTFTSYLTFDFDERWFRVPKGVKKHNRIKSREMQKKKFTTYVENSLAARLRPLPCIDKFRLYVNNIDNAIKARMEQWICASVNKNVKELDIQVNTKVKYLFLPDEVLLSTSITSLKLSGYILSGFSDIRMSNLMLLSIKDSIVVSEYAIEKIERGCPLLEDLRFVSCSGIFRISISSLLKLRRVEVHECGKVGRIEITARNLESFWYHADKDQEACKIELKCWGNLKNLTLKDGKMTDGDLREFVSECPLLEKLELYKCSNVERVSILSEKLRRLALIQCVKLKEVNVDAPNMCSLRYDGDRLPFASMNVLGLREAKFVFGPFMRTNECIAEYQQCFGSFDRSKGFKLIVYSKQNMTIYEEPREAHLVVPHPFCKLELTASLTSVSKAVDNWLRECHGESLVLISPGCELIKTMITMIMDREDNPSCCGMYSNKCWRHYIADVKILTLITTERMYYNFKWKSRN